MTIESEAHELTAFKLDLQEARAEVLSELEDINQIGEVEQDLIDSIDNVIAQIEHLEVIEKKETDAAVLRRERLKFAALIAFFNEIMDEMYGPEDSEDDDCCDEDDECCDEEEEEAEEHKGHNHGGCCKH